MLCQKALRLLTRFTLLVDAVLMFFWKGGEELVVADSLGRELLPLDELIAKKNAKKNDTDNKRPEEITADNNDDDTNKRFKEITGPLEKEGLGAAAEEDLGATAVSTMVRVAA